MRGAPQGVLMPIGHGAASRAEPNEWRERRQESRDTAPQDTEPRGWTLDVQGSPEDTVKGERGRASRKRALDKPLLC